MALEQILFEIDDIWVTLEKVKDGLDLKYKHMFMYSLVYYTYQLSHQRLQ